MDRSFMRLLCVSLAVMLLCQEAFAGMDVASASDARVEDVAATAPDAVLGGGGSGLLARASEEELERYYQSFMEYPVTLLDWPEGVPQPRFAIAALGAAAMYVLEVLAVMVGIYALGVSLDYLWKIYGNYETTLRLEGKESLLQTWQDVLSAQWGDAISGMGDLYKDFKAYCKENVKGYGSGDGSLTVAGSDALLVPGYDLGYSIYPSLPAFRIPGDILASVSSYTNSVIFASEGGWVHGAASNSPVVVQFTYNHLYGYYVPNIICDSSCISFKGYASNESAHEIIDRDSCILSLPRDGGYSFYVTGTPVVMVDGNEVAWSDDEEAVIAPAKPWEDLQWNYYDLAQSVSVPASQAEADEILANAAAAQNAAEVSKAFEKTWEMGDAVTDEEDKAYPWVPSITKWLEGIKNGIDSIKEKVMSIPDILAEILNGIRAIPGQIADFFTVDTAVVSESAAALEGAFTARFGGIMQLADIFKKSYQFGMETPVYTMSVPGIIKFAYPDTDEIVILDLRPYTTHFLWARGILTAVLYLLFAKWLLDQFDVKLHVG